MAKDDLISRAAAKQAIHDGVVSGSMVVRLWDIMDKMPTIDAIPVEWIQAQRTEHPQTVEEFARNVAYRTVLYGWRAEQEDE